MLTYHFIPLSNPVNPEMLYLVEIQRFMPLKNTVCGQRVDN